MASYLESWLHILCFQTNNAKCMWIFIHKKRGHGCTHHLNLLHDNTNWHNKTDTEDNKIDIRWFTQINEQLPEDKESFMVLLMHAAMSPDTFQPIKLTFPQHQAIMQHWVLLKGNPKRAVIDINNHRLTPVLNCTNDFSSVAVSKSRDKKKVGEVRIRRESWAHRRVCVNVCVCICSYKLELKSNSKVHFGFSSMPLISSFPNLLSCPKWAVQLLSAINLSVGQTLNVFSE